MHNYTTGIIASPATGQLTIAKEFRMYASNTCKNCDVVSYLFEGRASTTSAWVEIASGNLPWIDIPSSDNGRNGQQLDIISSYASPDPNLYSTSVHYHSHSVPYLDYRVTYVETRDPDENSLQYAEIEIPGMVLPLA